MESYSRTDRPPTSELDRSIVVTTNSFSDWTPSSACATIPGMSRFQRICVFAAFMLITAAGADLLSDFASADVCDSSNADQCFCSCGHFVVPVQPVISPYQTITFFESEQAPLPLSRRRSAVYHPPRS